MGVDAGAAVQTGARPRLQALVALGLAPGAAPALEALAARRAQVRAAHAVLARLRLAERLLAVHALEALEALARVVVARGRVCRQASRSEDCEPGDGRPRAGTRTWRRGLARGAAGSARLLRAGPGARQVAACAAPVGGTGAREAAVQVAARAAVEAWHGLALVDVVLAPGPGHAFH